ncbi:hypothetical protein F4778DRAFT_152306 [Xylariomycetidae sp. FL2044]|nr:hypothetical protein F4778DRAFT_152306 [Xylariomycetidae sp. FL2044]
MISGKSFSINIHLFIIVASIAAIVPSRCKLNLPIIPKHGVASVLSRKFCLSPSTMPSRLHRQQNSASFLSLEDMRMHLMRPRQTTCLTLKSRLFVQANDPALNAAARLKYLTLAIASSQQ